ncbi:hypothetical protein P6B95_25845 [Streptomyces atratus]|uniref:hypothetical protein n=1 Tax=Streptomyces atratus TaxID=1893 RepID=UPI002AC33097|nr:hypothetical protein [Streptomyces atratus]WPW30453.1 hypothetical protein P6B95_25845 [Streptomyces atratus]
MGIESDQLVYDYLSRVGDLAQQQQLSSGTRMRLVATLRGEIDRQRGEQSGDAPAAVRRIIGRLGTPDELVAAAAASADGTVELPQGPGPAAGEGRGVPRPRKGMLRKDSSGKGASRARAQAPDRDPENTADTADTADSAAPEAAAGRVPSPPHMAGTDELGPSGSEPDWWRIEPEPFGDGVDVPGFVGGVEIPDMMKPPPARDAVPRPRAGDSADDGPAEDVGTDEAAPRRRRLPGLRRRAPRESRARGFSHPFLLLAAGLLVVGAVMGSWLALAGGWLLAYSSRKLSRAEAKWAAMGLPGVVVAGALVWLWGRTEGRWGEPIPQDGMAEALSGVWPVVVRTAAVASAVFLVWRARKREG